MRILALSNLYPPNAVGGYEMLCFEVMQALARRGHEVTVLTSDYGERREDYPDHRVHRRLTLLADGDNIYAPFNPDPARRQAINQGNLEILAEVMADAEPELVFVWNLHFFDPSLPAAVDALAPPAVYLLTDNWLLAARQPEFIADYFATEVFAAAGLKPALKRWWRRLRRLRRPEASFAGRAIFPSRFMAELYRQGGLSFARQAIVYHGISAGPPPTVPPAREQLRRPGELNLLFAGRLVEIKGVHTALAALPAIIRALPELRVRLTIVGDDRDRDYRERLHAACGRPELAGVVTFRPPVAEAALPALFDDHDIYLFPSLYEPFSLTLIHALRAGIPTVAAAAGGNPEIVHHRQTGRLFTPGDPRSLADQVVALARDGARRRRLAARAAEHAATYTFERMVDELEKNLLAAGREDS